MSLTISSAMLAIVYAACPVSPTFAQLSPSQPIKIVLGLAPGGAADVGTRVLANGYADQIGRQVVVENRPGGGGAAAAMAVKSARGDGHTLLVMDNGTCCANIFLSNVGYDATRDFKPVLMLWGYPNLLVVGANSPDKSVADLVARARKSSGGLTYGSQGVGTGGHILGAMLAKAANIPLVHVPFRGAAPAATEVAAGRIDLFFASFASVRPFIEDGRVRPLATTAEKVDDIVVPGHPSLPIMADLGYREVTHDAWFMLLAPVDTPDTVVQQLHAEFAKVLRSESVLQKLRSLQMHASMTSTPADLMRRMRGEIEINAPIMKDLAGKGN